MERIKKNHSQHQQPRLPRPRARCIEVSTAHRDGYRSRDWEPIPLEQLSRKMAPASSGWLETAQEMERYVREGESARDTARFAVGELEGAASAARAVASGTWQVVRHPLATAQSLGEAVAHSGPALVDFSRHSQELTCGAVGGQLDKLLSGDARECGRNWGKGLATLGMMVAPMPRGTAVVRGPVGSASVATAEPAALAAEIGSAATARPQYFIQSGVRRSTAAREGGKALIRGRVHRPGQKTLPPIEDIPVQDLHAPAGKLEVPYDRRWHETLWMTLQGKRPPVITVEPLGLPGQGPSVPLNMVKIVRPDGPRP